MKVISILSFFVLSFALLVATVGCDSLTPQHAKPSNGPLILTGSGTIIGSYSQVTSDTPDKGDITISLIPGYTTSINKISPIIGQTVAHFDVQPPNPVDKVKIDFDLSPSTPPLILSVNAFECSNATNSNIARC